MGGETERAHADSLSAEHWLAQIARHERDTDKWVRRADTIIKRYRQDDVTAASAARMNILWANIQTLLPAVYARLPQPEVVRRWKDADPAGRVAAQILERALDYEVQHNDDYKIAVPCAIEDRLLVGRGTAWVRYEPDIERTTDVQITNDSDDAGEQAPGERIINECAPVDYVNWRDFGHSPARTWDEVTAVWRVVYLTRAQLVERFGEEIGHRVPLDANEVGDDDRRDGEKTKAAVYEIWDKATKRAIWVCKGSPLILDAQDDPLGLDGFFPCPRPLYATLTTGSLIPIPDYLYYQDLAIELDVITQRIDLLVRACKVSGVYNAAIRGIQSVLQTGTDNSLVPVDEWAVFAERGGIKGNMDFVPLGDVVNALQRMYEARAQVMQMIYEVTGLSDIIRGASKAQETATAQRIKSQFASLRLRRAQDEVARFATDLLRMKAQIMCQHYQPETLLRISGAEQMGESPELVMRALALLKDRPTRTFRIDVAADSLIAIDEQGEKQDRLEFLAAAGKFMTEAIPLAQASPALAPLVGEMLMFGVRAFKAARPIEGAFDRTVAALQQQAQQRAQQQAGPPPEPESVQVARIKQQTDLRQMQIDAQIEQQKLAADVMAQRRRELEDAARARYGVTL